MSWTYAGQYGAEQIIDTVGAPQPNAAVTVYLHSTLTMATLYTDRTKATAAANPTTTDALGNLTFYADPGAYDLAVSGFANTVTVYASLDSGDVVSTFNGRAGIVAPVADDYTAEQIGSTGVAEVFNVRTYGATGNGSTDDSAAIQAAINACQTAGGGTVFFPGGTYLLNAGLTITADNVHLVGTGFATHLTVVSGATFDMVATGIPAAAGDSGYIRNYISVERMWLDYNTGAGTVAGQGNGIHFYGARYSTIRDVMVTSCPNWAVVLDGDNTTPGFNFGYNCLVEGLISDVGAAGVLTFSCEANIITGCVFKYSEAATAASQPAFGAKGTSARHVDLDSGYNVVSECVLGAGGTSDKSAILTENSGPCRIVNNRFDQVRAAAVELRAGNHIFADNTLTSPATQGGWEAIRLSSNDNTVVGNEIDNTAGTIAITYSIADAGTARTGNVIANNRLYAGSSGVISQTAGSGNIIRDNLAYNPVGGGVAQPAMPASATAVTNTTGVDCTVVIACGAGITVSAVAIGTTTTGLTVAASGSAAVTVPANQTITLTYAGGTPTWVWLGD